MSDAEERRGRKPFKVRMPGFVRDEDIGLGQAVKYVTARAGIRPCGGCQRRAAALDRWVVLSPRNRN
ncbi:hypothetical protein [Streptomyces sp. NPDC057403]|uniref:hypothetical protein n=1 Tax=Streptomyces sp. NPDC057403 TaxID=3346119 RepID=UPI003692A7F6